MEGLHGLWAMVQWNHTVLLKRGKKRRKIRNAREDHRASPQQVTLDPGEKKKVLVKLWWLRMCFLFLTVGSGSNFKPYTHPVTAQSWNTQTKKQKTKGILPTAIMKKKWGTVTVTELWITQRRRTLINTTKKRNRRDLIIYNCLLFCDNPIVLCH